MRLDSTLIRSGEDAATFREMIAFAESLENRPLDTLIEELAGLARLSVSKFGLARQILRKRFRAEPAAEKQRLRILARRVTGTIEPTELRAQIEAIFEADPPPLVTAQN